MDKKLSPDERDNLGRKLFDVGGALRALGDSLTELERVFEANAPLLQELEFIRIPDVERELERVFNPDVEQNEPFQDKVVSFSTKVQKDNPANETGNGNVNDEQETGPTDQASEESLSKLGHPVNTIIFL